MTRGLAVDPVEHGRFTGVVTPWSVNPKAEVKATEGYDFTKTRATAVELLRRHQSGAAGP